MVGAQVLRLGGQRELPRIALLEDPHARERAKDSVEALLLDPGRGGELRHALAAQKTAFESQYPVAICIIPPRSSSIVRLSLVEV
jgi:hypothetical protein